MRSSQRRKPICASTANSTRLQQRDDRLGAFKLAEFCAKKAEAESRAARRQCRQEYLNRIQVRFDTGDKWTRSLLVEQAEGRGIKSCQAWITAKLLVHIKKWDRALPLEQLRKFLSNRGLGLDHSKAASALKMLRAHDNKTPMPESVKLIGEDADGMDEDLEDAEEAAEAEAEEYTPDEPRPPAKRVREGRRGGGGCE